MTDIFVNDLRPDNDPSLDLVHRITTFEELVSFFKMQIRRDLGEEQAADDEQYFKLVGFYLRSGIAAYIPKILGENGNPLGQILVFRHWQGADPFPGPVNPPYFDTGVGGFTNADGDIGFGYAGESVVLENGGPDALWVSADPPGGERQHSDCVTNLGWFGGTNHLTANPIFQVATKAGEPPAGNGDNRLVVFDIQGNEVGFVVLQTGSGSGQGRIALFQDGIETDFALFTNQTEKVIRKLSFSQLELVDPYAKFKDE